MFKQNNRERINIAFIISNLGQGGAERQMVELIKGIDKKLFYVSLILYAYQKDSFYHEIFDISGITVIKNRLKNSRAIPKISEALTYLRRTLGMGAYDIVFTSLFMNNFFVRLVSTSQYDNRIVANTRTSIKHYPKYYLIAEKLLIRKSIMVFNSTKSLREFQKVLPKRYQYNMSMIYNGFDIPSHTEHFSTENNMSITFGGLGRQTHIKNFLQLVRAYIQIESINITNTNMRLILQGNSGDESSQINKLKNKCTTNIFIREPNPDIAKFFSEIDIMVLPSYFEGCPNVLFEALLRKKLCIISVGANSDNFIVDGDNGFVYDGTDSGLSNAMNNAIEILGTKNARLLTENGYNYVKEHFSMKKMIRNYSNLFLRIHEKNKSSC